MVIFKNLKIAKDLQCDIHTLTFQCDISINKDYPCWFQTKTLQCDIHTSKGHFCGFQSKLFQCDIPTDSFIWHPLRQRQFHMTFYPLSIKPIMKEELFQSFFPLARSSGWTSTTIIMDQWNHIKNWISHLLQLVHPQKYSKK